MYRLLLLIALSLPVQFGMADTADEPTFRHDLPCESVEQMNRLLAFSEAMQLLKAVESFRSQPYWDVNAWRCGYGTLCNRNATISTQDAATAAASALSVRLDAVRLRYPHLTERQIAGLAVMRYNVGSFGPGLDQAIRSGDQDRIDRWMLRYTKAAGEHLPGLRKRRLLEIRLIRNKLA